MPRLTAAFLIITLSSIGLPGLNGFVGEFLIMLGAFRWDPRFVVGAGLGVILSAVYMLWMFQRVYYGKVTNAEERDAAGSAAARVGARWCRSARWRIVMGVFPTIFLKPMEPAVHAHRRAHAGVAAAARRSAAPQTTPSHGRDRRRDDRRCESRALMR